jgi:hypothetical protein
MSVSTPRPTHESDWGVTCYEYPDSAEATAWKGVRYGNKKGVQRDKDKTTRDEMDPETLAAAISRARKTVRVKTASIGADHMITLTYRDNMLDHDKLWNDFKYLLKLIRQNGWEGHYVAVAEKQKRGAWHLHVAVSGRQDVKLWRNTWRRVVGDIEGKSGGNIHVRGPESLKKLGLMNSGMIAQYLSKYINKYFDTGLIGVRRYRTSINIKIKKNVVYCVPSISNSATLMNLYRVFEEITGYNVRSHKVLEEYEVIKIASWSINRKRSSHGKHREIRTQHDNHIWQDT